MSWSGSASTSAAASGVPQLMQSRGERAIDTRSMPHVEGSLVPLRASLVQSLDRFTGHPSHRVVMRPIVLDTGLGSWAIRRWR